MLTELAGQVRGRTFPAPHPPSALDRQLAADWAVPYLSPQLSLQAATPPAEAPPPSLLYP